jgi:hypothetical protein
MRRLFLYLLGMNAAAQTVFTPVQHLNFDRPESWALKYFTSATIMSGLQPPEPDFERRGFGAITFGLEAGYLPTLSPEQARVGFGGRKEEDINKSPLFARPSIRIGLPWRLTLVAAGPPPFQLFGVTPRLFAFGVERPILERKQWRLGWRASGQVGSVKGSFTCPQRVLAFPGGTPNNPSACIATSSDVIEMRYAGTEIQFSHRIPKVPRLSVHAAAGVNLVEGIFQVNAQLQGAIDNTRLWTRGTTFTSTAGVSYLLTKRVALTVDAFYSPLWVQRDVTHPATNEGLFNVRALLSFAAR